MTSKIINMAERIKDAEDRLLESMFANEAIADDGFSARVVGKVRRRIWLRRLALPVATLIGAVVSFKPLVGLVMTLAELSQLIPRDVLNMLNASAVAVPLLPMLVLGGMLLATCLIGVRLLDDS